MRCLGYGLDYPEAAPDFWIMHYENWEAVYLTDDDGAVIDSNLENAILERCYNNQADGFEDGECPSLAACLPPQGCGHGGLHNCSKGYDGDRCTSCANRFYKLNGLCEPCPVVIFPVWGWALVTFGVLLGGAIGVEWIWSNTSLKKISASDMGMITAPIMVLLAFLQTISIVLDIPRIKFPPELRELLSALNIM